MSEDKLNTAVLLSEVDAIVNMIYRRFVAAHGRLPRLGEKIIEDDDLIGLPNLESNSEHTS